MTRVSFGSPALLPDRLLCGDALSVLAAEPSASLDVVYIDPPFGTGKRQKGRHGAYQDPAGRSRTDDETPLGPYLPWLRERLVEAHRVLVPTGSLFVHLDYRAVHYVRVELDRLFGYQRLINEIIWAYSVGGKSPRAFGRKHDTILWFARGPRHAFFPEAIRVPRRPGSHMRVSLDEAGNPVQEKTDRKTGRVYRYPVALGKVPEDVWTGIETLNRGDSERTGWPSQKPTRLIERLLRASCPPGGRVADVFAGSGTTAVVAQRAGFNFLASDLSPEALAIARRRLELQGQALGSAGRPIPDLVVEIARGQ